MDTEDRGDTLGSLQGRFSGRIHGIKWFAAAAVLALIGLVFLIKADYIAHNFFGIEETARPSYIAGGVFLLLALGVALPGGLLFAQWLEVRRKGVRHGSLLGTRQLRWRDISNIHVRKVTTLSSGRGRTSSFVITLSSNEGRIRLGSLFLGAVSPLGVLQLLKLHGARALSGDVDDLPLPRGSRLQDDFDDEPLPVARPSKKRAAKSAPGGTDVYKGACDRLARGVPAPEVESWLQSQGVPAAAAAALVDKAMASKLAGDAAAKDASEGPEADTVAQARRKLAAGEKPERVERWLREQGFSAPMASAWLENLRQELL
jgi:hypothetical protein